MLWWWHWGRFSCLRKRTRVFLITFQPSPAVLFPCWQKKDVVFMTSSVSDFAGPVLQISVCLKHFSHLLPHCSRIHLQWTTARHDPYIQVHNSFHILWALLFSTILKMCRSHAEHIYAPKRPVFPGNFSSFCCSLKPALITALSGSLDFVPSGAEVGSAQHSVVVYLNLQLEECPRRESCESTNTTWVSNENTTE